MARLNHNIGTFATSTACDMRLSTNGWTKLPGWEYTNSTDNLVYEWDGVAWHCNNDFPLLTGRAGDTLTLADDAATPSINITERSSPPTTPALHDLYIDDGTNTGSGQRGWRICVSISPSVWEDLGAVAHSALSNLTFPADDHTQYAYLTGRSGGQSFIGGTGSAENLQLTSTSDLNKGLIYTEESIRAARISVNNQSGSTYTLDFQDAGRTIFMANADGTLYIPLNDSVAFEVDTAIVVVCEGAATTITAINGVTLNGVSAGTPSAAINNQYGAVTLIKREINTWIMFGDNAAVA